MAVSQASAGGAASITPADSTTFGATRGVYVGGAGDLTVRMVGSQSNVTFASVPAGTILPIRVDRILSTGTTATSIVALT